MINDTENIEEIINEPAENGSEEKAAANEPTVSELLEKIASLEAQLKEKDDQHLRMMAEYENFRRRSREEKEALYDVAVADTVSEILPIIDNLERAYSFENGDQVKDGLLMIANSVGSALGKLKIEPVGAVGEKFDPNLHNAVLHTEDSAFGEGEIAEVFQKGYKKGNKIIRFAMVKTAN